MLKSLLKDSFLYSVFDVFSKGIAALLFPVFTHFLKVEDFGILSLITIINTLGVLLIEFGINNAVQLMYYEYKQVSDKRKLVSTGFFLQVIIGIAVSVLLFIALYSLQNLIAKHYQIRFSWVVLSILMILPGLLIKYILNILRLHHRPIIFGLISFVTNLLWMFLAIVLFKTTELGISGYLISNFLFLLVTLPLAIFSIKSEINVNLNRQLARKIIHLGSPFIISNIAFWVFGSMDRWILAEFTDLRQVGLYSVAFKFAAIVTLVSNGFSQAWGPAMLKNLYESESTAISNISRVSALYLNALGIFCSALILFLPEVFKILTPAEYWNAKYAAAILVTALFANSISQFTATGVTYNRKTRLINLVNCTAIGFNAVLTIFLSMWYGALGSAIALLLTYFFWTNLYKYFSDKYFAFRFNYSIIILPVIMLLVSNCVIFFENSVSSYVDYTVLFSIKLLVVLVAITIFFKDNRGLTVAIAHNLKWKSKKITR